MESCESFFRALGIPKFEPFADVLLERLIEKFGDLGMKDSDDNDEEE